MWRDTGYPHAGSHNCCRRNRQNAQHESRRHDARHQAKGLGEVIKAPFKVPYIISVYLEEEMQTLYNWYGSHSVWRWAGTATAAVPAIVLLSENTAGKDNPA